MGDPSRRSFWLSVWNWFVEPLKRAQDEARSYLTSARGGRFDGKTVSVLVLAAVLLATQRFLAVDDGIPRSAGLLELIGLDALAERLRHSESHSLNQLAWWAAVCVATYFVVPALFVRLVLRERLSDYGIKPRGALSGWPIYLGMIALMAPLVYWMSAHEEFLATYPFYVLPLGQPLWPTFWYWEAMYAVQFFALEFFFRGFLLHGTRHRFEGYAIPVMVIPYCMIHFHKPMPEAFASIVAGLALGYMSLRTRSIWLGAAIHVTVALSMDFASLWRQGRLG
jgi:uncharacterized protein